MNDNIILLHGRESWTIRVDLRKRLEAFEMWAYRHMLKISRTQKVTNESCDELVVSAIFQKEKRCLSRACASE
ncbi:jg17077 [Pararge aegeria aegeria]|uniref:Jg17077 protein n=1 Tax=Pararge aegeria aegeria TaxID=348720 RepID=A0A8S4R4Z9_9NEOP|nr:jg17077 [Pararge aegeria aegeria]